MVLPPGHAQTIAAPRQLSGREKRLLGGVLALLGAIVAVLVVSIAVSGSASGHGCIHATVPGAVGAEEIDQCGAQARTTCQTVEHPGSFTAASARVVAGECRKAGLPTGR